MSTPHDALFKAVFGDPEDARGALAAAMPPQMTEAIDWARLVRVPGSFVDPELHEQHTDLLFSTAFHGNPALIYVLFEHQSTSDPWMGFRLLRYLVRIWDRWQDTHPGESTLPVILPVVLYHGTTAWSAPRSFTSLFALPEPLSPAIAPHLVRFEYLVDDLSRASDGELRARKMTALAKLVAVCFKYVRIRGSFLDVLIEHAEILRQVDADPRRPGALGLVIRYAFRTRDDVDRIKLYDFLEREISPNAKDTAMTVGDQLIEEGKRHGIQEGIRRGIQEGIQQGIQQGSQQTAASMLLRLLQQRFGASVDANVEGRVTTAPISQIEAWTDRVLSADTLAELLAG